MPVINDIINNEKSGRAMGLNGTTRTGKELTIPANMA